MTERNRQPDRDIDLEDPLGIARTPVESDAKNISHEADDEATIRRRRARAGLDGHDDRPRPGMGDINTDPDGAAGIDMGSGGEGTDVKP